MEVVSGRDHSKLRIPCLGVGLPGGSIVLLSEACEWKTVLGDDGLCEEGRRLRTA